MCPVVLFAPPRGVALAVLFVALFSLTPVDPARAQDGGRITETLPAIDVISTRIGTRSSSSSVGSRSTSSSAPSSGDGVATSIGAPVVGGITGTSTTIITSEDLRRAPQSTLQDILSREAGIQTTSLYGGVNGTGTAVDMRGFGVTAPSNVLVLVDGRRFNDADIPGFDFSLIPMNSIERVEITRGNSGGVLYGDGAVGGVIHIVTKNGAGTAPNARVEGAFGSFNTREGKISASGSSNGFSAAVFGNAFSSDGYRANNKTLQNQAVGDLNQRRHISGDDTRQRLPGPRNILNGTFVGFIDEYSTDRRGTDTPLNYSNRQNMAMRGGVTRKLWSGAELTVDGSFRQKHTQRRLLCSLQYPLCGAE